MNNKLRINYTLQATYTIIYAVTSKGHSTVLH